MFTSSAGVSRVDKNLPEIMLLFVDNVLSITDESRTVALRINSRGGVIIGLLNFSRNTPVLLTDKT
jgi:hypothetical protein